MGKKYLETKKGSLESSILGVWQNAIEEGDARVSAARMDGRTTGYKSHRAKLETARARREEKKKSSNINEEQLDEKSAKYLEIEFKDSTTAANAYSYINNKIEPGGRQPWDDFNQEGSSIQFDNMKDADSLMKELGKKFKFKVYEREEVELDEGSTQVLAHGGKGQYKVVSGPAKDGSRETVVKFKGKVVSKGDYDSGADGWFMNIKGKKGQEFFDDAQKMADYFAKNKITEEVELDEGKMKELHMYIQRGKSAKWIAKEMGVDEKTIKSLMGEEVGLMNAVEEQLAKIKGKTPGDEGRRGAVEDDIERAEKKGDKKLVKKLKEDDLDEGYQVYVKSTTAKSGWIAQGQPWKTEKDAKKDAKNFAPEVTKVVKEELDLNEWTVSDVAIAMKKKYGKIDKEAIEKLKKVQHMGNVDRNDLVKVGHGKLHVESVELDEVSFKVKDDVVYISKDEYIALPGEGKGKDEEGNPTLNVFMTDDEDEDPTPLPVKFVESARSDAMKAMRSDPQLGKRSDKEDDDSATDDDVKGASKNIIMQMRKVISLRGRFEVEFLDGKKIKIPEKIARSVQDKYDSFRKPRDKEKFQAKVAKSYKSMLSALKESFLNEKSHDATEFECLECGKKFKKKIGRHTVDVKCPKCGGYDVEIAEEKTNQNRILGLVSDKIRENKNG